jgi:hypothetical protein
VGDVSDDDDDGDDAVTDVILFSCIFFIYSLHVIQNIMRKRIV